MSNSFRRSYCIDSRASRDYRLQRFDIQRYGDNSSPCRCFCHNNFVSNNQFDVLKNDGYERNYSYIQNMRNRYNNCEVSDKKYSDYNNVFRFNQPYFTNYNKYSQFGKTDGWKPRLHFRYGDREKEEMEMIAGTKNHRYQLNSANDYKNKSNFQYGNHAEAEMKMIAGTKKRRYEVNKANDYKNKFNFQYERGVPSFEEQQKVMLANMRKKNYLVDKTRRILYGNGNKIQSADFEDANKSGMSEPYSQYNNRSTYVSTHFKEKKNNDRFLQLMEKLRTKTNDVIRNNEERLNQINVEKGGNFNTKNIKENKSLNYQSNHQFYSSSNISGQQKSNYFRYNDNSYEENQQNIIHRVDNFSEKYQPKDLCKKTSLWIKGDKKDALQELFNNNTNNVVSNDDLLTRNSKMNIIVSRRNSGDYSFSQISNEDLYKNNKRNISITKPVDYSFIANEPENQI